MSRLNSFAEGLGNELENAGETLRKISGEMSGKANKERMEILDDINKKIALLSLEGKKILLDALKLVKDDGGDWSGNVSNDKISGEELKELTILMDYLKMGFIDIPNGRPLELNLDEYINKLERDIQENIENIQAEELKNKL